MGMDGTAIISLLDELCTPDTSVMVSSTSSIPAASSTKEKLGEGNDTGEEVSDS